MVLALQSQSAHIKWTIMADEGKEKKGCCEKVGDGFSNFAKFLFNRETGQVMGRSGESWCKYFDFVVVDCKDPRNIDAQQYMMNMKLN